MPFILALVVLIVLSLTMCGSDSEDGGKEWKSAEFRTLSECLDSIEEAARSELRIVTDKPSRVSGRLVRTDGAFMCTLKESGTKGTYYEALFEE